MTKLRLCLVATTFAVFGHVSSADAAPAVAAGAQHVVVLTSGGTLWVWGGNGYGQLGNGTTTARPSPTPIASPSAVSAIAAGRYNTFALQSDGTVWAWGDNASGQIGDGTQTRRTSPVTVSGLSNVIAIAAGIRHVLALRSDGTVWAWGDNAYGQLGDGTTTLKKTPAQIASLGSAVTSIGAHGNNSHAVKSDGTLWSWGANANGEVGDGTTTSPRTSPVQTSGLTSMVAADGGSGFSYGITSAGELKSWGLGSDGELGNGTTTARQTTPVTVSGMSSTAVVRGGNAHAVAAKTDGTVWAWGYNGTGQIGDNSTTTRTSPVQIAEPTGIVSVAAEAYFSVVVSSDGRVWAWGDNAYGQLGDGTTNQRNAPAQLSDVDFAWRVATPRLSPSGGLFSANVNVTISCVTSGATIHYTTSGTDPTEADPTIASGGVIAVTQTTIVKAMARLPGAPGSNVATGVFTLTVTAPSFSPGGGTYTSAQNVTISTPTSGAVIRCTTDGTAPTEASPLCSAPIAVSTGTTLKAIALKPGWTTSNMRSATYTFNYGPLTAPVFTPAPGQYSTAQQVTITAAPFATIRYTTNGTTPTASSTIYTGPLTVNATTTILAKAFHADWTTSAQSGGVYTLKVAAPAFSPESGTYAPGQLVAITDATPGAVIRYTINGTDPTASDPIIQSGDTIVAGNYTLRARAFITGWTSSDVTSAAYVLDGPLASWAVSAGSNHSVALRTDGTVWTWGANTDFALGDTGTSRSIPAIVNGLSGVIAITSGLTHNLALRADGTVWAWGGNVYGQLGDNTTTSRSMPTIVTGLGSVTAIAAGSFFSVALTSDGTVWTWGRNNSGQLGDGSTTQRSLPAQVPGLIDVVAVAAGDAHAIVRKDDGSLWAWGANSSGQLGDGTSTQRTSPVPVTGLNAGGGPWAGTSHTLAIGVDGGLWAWGLNNAGQLGLGTVVNKSVPTLVPGFGSAIAMDGSASSIAIDSGRSVWVWGANGFGQVGDGATTSQLTPFLVPGIVDVVGVAVSNHSLIVTGDGIVWAWGYNNTGQLGDGTITSRSTPVQISEAGFAWKTSTPRLSPAPGTYATNTNVTITAVTPGAEIHYTTDGADPTQADPTIASGGVLAVTQTLTISVRAWATGLPPSNVSRATYTLKPSTPTISPGGGTYTSARTVTIATSTSGATIFYTVDGSSPTESSPVYTGPLTIATGTTLKAMAWKSGWTPSTVTTATYTFNYGTLAAPGFSPPAGEVIYGQTVAISAAPVATIRYTTNGSTPTSSSPIYTDPIAIIGTTTIYAKAFHPDYTTSPQAGGLYTARVGVPVFSPEGGAFPYAQLITISNSTPGAVIHYTTNGLDPTANDPVIANGGTLHAGNFTLKARAFMTGATTSAVTAATYTQTVPPRWSVAAGFNHSVLLDADGTVWTWGANTDGVLGDDSIARSSPAHVADLTGVTAVSAGASHVLALRADGTVWAWGANGGGQLGVDDTVLFRSAPAAVAGLSSVTAIAAGSFFSVALTSDGTVWTWGENEMGQLGDGTRGSRATPMPVPGLSNVVAIAAGYGHVVVRTQDGSLWAWGDNESGQLGDGTTQQRLSPTLVPGVTGASGPWAGYAHTFVATADGALWAWGANRAGQLGLGQAGESRLVPTLVPTIANVRMVAAAGHSVAVVEDGTVWTWGNNALGSVGDGSSQNRVAPYQVAGLTNASHVAAGLNHTLMVTSDGMVWTWGYNGDSELGDGTIDERSTTVSISEPGTLWRTSAPTFWPPAGLYSAITRVTLGATTPGAVIHYTTNGADPTLADPAVAPGGTVVVGRSLTLKVAAWAPGYAGSAVLAATYTIAAPPTCSAFVSPPSIVADGRGQTGYVAVTTSGAGCTTWTPTTDATWVTLEVPTVDPWAGYQQRVLADGPVAYWTFDDAMGGGTTVQDLTGHGVTATLIGGATVTTRGSLSLDGATGRALVGASSRFGLTRAFTIEVWLGTTSEQGRMVGAINEAWSLHMVTGGYVELRMLGQALRSATAINDGEQHFVNATWTGSVAALYIDGALDVQMPLSGTLPTSAGGLMMGADPLVNDAYAGLLDDVVVFDVALGAGQIADRFVWDNGEQSATSGVFAYTIAANPVGTPRVAAIGVADQSIVVTQSAAPPAIATVSPGSGAVGTAVTIAGTGFGAQQGGGSVWLGSQAAGTIVTWSETQIVATVATGSVSGTAQVRQNGAASNRLAFSVAAPSITNVTISGDGTQVTITGSGFGAAQGSGQLWLGTAAGVVTSWNNNQIVATVAPGSNAGHAQILQGGVWGNAVPFTPAQVTPHIDGIWPTVGAAGTAVTIYGSGFGSSQGAGIVSIGGAFASVNAWSETQVSATVAAGAISGVLKVQQNGMWTNAVTFRVPSATTNVTVTPNVMSLVVGDTRTVQALNPTGGSVSGLTWVSSDPAIVGLSTDDPPVLTAVASGNVTVSAGGLASADVTVYATSVPEGAVLWSDPGNASGVSGMYIAVPNYDAVADVFAVQNDGSVQAITSDGTVAWTATPPQVSWRTTFLPDFQGGLVVFEPQSISRLKGLTGEPVPLYTPTKAEAVAWGMDPPAIHPDGTIVTTDYGCGSVNCPGSADPEGAWVIGIDPTSGATKFSAPLASSIVLSHVSDATFCQNSAPGDNHFDYHSWPASSIIIAGDGSAYLSYATSDSEGTVRRAAAQPFPDAVYDLWDQVTSDTTHSNFAAAAAALTALNTAVYGAGGGGSDLLLVALQNGDRTTAITLENVRAPTYRRPCDRTDSLTTKLHLLRVGMDGTSSDVVVKQWTETSSTVFTLVGDHGYHITETETGPSDVRIDWVNIITNADQGALYSWQATETCYPDADYGLRSYRHVGTCATDTEHHLTTTAGGAIGSDVVWDQGGASGWSPLRSTLQLEDGSFAGSVQPFSGGVTLVVFDVTGHVRWSVPGVYPEIATAGGELVASYGSAYYTFDSGGSAIGRFSDLPSYSWLQNGYVSSGSVARVGPTSLEWGSGYASMSGGNPSANGTAVGFVQNVESVPVFTEGGKSDSCSEVPSDGGVQIPLADDPDDVNRKYSTLYQDLKNSLLSINPSSGIGYLDVPANGATSSCFAFFNTWEPTEPHRSSEPLPPRAAYFDQLKAAAGSRRVFDGHSSTISMYEAGMLSPFKASISVALRSAKRIPVCRLLRNPQTRAAAQLFPRPNDPDASVRDVYMNTSPGAVKLWTESTILHETLHNLTGFEDYLDPGNREGVASPFHLKAFVGILDKRPGEDPFPGNTLVISQKLVAKGCAPR